MPNGPGARLPEPVTPSLARRHREPAAALTPEDRQNAARLAVGEGADGGGDHVGGAVDVLGDRAGRVAHRRGHLRPAQPGQHGGGVLDLRQEIAVPGGTLVACRWTWA